MALFDRYLSRGDFRFSCMLAYYMTWYYALQHTLFSFYILARIVFYFLVCWLLFGFLLFVLAKWRGKSACGKPVLWYFPWKAVCLIAIGLSLFVGASYAFFVCSMPLSSTSVLILSLGCLGSIALIILYLHALVKKD